MKEEIIRNVKERKLIAIIRGIRPDDCVKLGQALQTGGINMIEITFNQNANDHHKDTIQAITMMKEKLGNQVYVGAGTVMNCEQVDLAKAAGAEYIITPVVNPAVIRYAGSLDMVTMPGAFTPTEIAEAYEAGADFVKVFPAGNIGPEYIKAIRSPMPDIPLLAVGGINEKNVAAYLAAGAAGAGIGGNLVNRTWILEEKFDQITALARQYVDAVSK